MAILPVLAILGVIAITLVVRVAGTPALSVPIIFTRRPAPILRGNGIGGSTTPGFGCPSGPISDCLVTFGKNIPNQ